MRSRPWFSLFLSPTVNQPVELEDVLRHRRTTAKIAVAALIDASTGALTMFAAIAGTVMTIRGGHLNPYMFFGLLIIGAYCAIRSLRWLARENPVASTLLWGGTVYILNDVGSGYGFTTEIGVARNPNILGVAVATVPGILFFRRAELRQFKPYWQNAEIPWNVEGIEEAMERRKRQPEYDRLWD